jgi:sporulation protein YlmC with PRC-barrel domain
MKRNFPLNADVHCTDGFFGRSTHLLVNPATERVTHIVIKRRKEKQKKFMVPVRFIKETTPELILLTLTKEKLTEFETFDQIYFSKRQIQRFGADPMVTLLWPYVVPENKVIAGKYSSVPPGELAVRRGAKVKATDGFVGQVTDFMVDPETGYISHMVLREGLPWDKKYITIAIAEIDHIDEKIVFLKLSKKKVKELPAIKIRQPDMELT